MPKGAALSEVSSGESISHFASIRIRVTGIRESATIINVGGIPTLVQSRTEDVKLELGVYSLDNVRFKPLVPFALKEFARIIPTRIVNFMEQRAAFNLSTTKIDERFRINRIVIFTREVFSSYPGS